MKTWEAHKEVHQDKMGSRDDNTEEKEEVSGDGCDGAQRDAYVAGMA